MEGGSIEKGRVTAVAGKGRCVQKAMHQVIGETLHQYVPGRVEGELEPFSRLEEYAQFSLTLFLAPQRVMRHLGASHPVFLM